MSMHACTVFLSYVSKLKLAQLGISVISFSKLYRLPGRHS